MAKKRGKRTIPLDEIKLWISMNEEQGLSAPQISRERHYDVRTIRKHLTVAKSGGELREARVQVLREALIKHYDQLTAFARQLANQITSEQPQKVVLGQSEIVQEAIREHLPRLRTWRDIEKWNSTVSQYEETIKLIKDKTIKSGAYRNITKLVLDEGQGFQFAMEFHLRGLALGGVGLGEVDYSISNTPTGKRVARAGFGLAIVPEGRIKEIQDTLNELMAASLKWDEYKELQKIMPVIRKLAQLINMELTKIAMRGVLPGRCSLCPF